jgi:CheY-like chemotaxis protein
MTKTILIVEDDDVIRENLKEILEMEAYHVETARHGKEALEYLRSHASSKPSLILLDINMPVMSGPEFLSALRNEDNTHSGIPVVVMTAVPEVGDLGTAGFLKKPLTLDHLLSKVSQLLSEASTVTPQ